MNTALAAAATLVALAFAANTLDRWLRRRRPHEAAWSVALALFALGSGALWWAEADGWNLAAFRVFYLAGAVLNVPWLALGTVYLLAGVDAGDKVREIYFRRDRPGGVLVLECESVEQARELLGTLPMVKGGLTEFELIPVGPYDRWSVLFA